MKLFKLVGDINVETNGHHCRRKTSLIHKQTISAEQRTSETTNEDEEIGFAILNIYLWGSVIGCDTLQKRRICA